MLSGLWRLARPTDWIKNVFVLVPIPFALADKAHFQPLPFLLGLGGFCLLTSAVYAFNDLLDVEADRLHPRKCRRPIAAGEISPTAAAVQFAVLLLLAMGLCAAAASLLGNTDTVVMFLVYIGVNLVYSLGAKHVALLDVFLLSSGFVIRVLLGCALMAAAPSAWLLLCTSALAFFLGFAKRRADLAAGLDGSHRPSLRGYTQTFLDQAITICAGVALLSYALYSVHSELLIEGREMASMPLVAYGILNYLRLADVEKAGSSPVEVALSSRSSQLCAVAWMAAVVWSLKIW